MAEPEPGPPVVALPQPVDRRLRLGPFASARDAVKFACYAAAGALLAPFVTPYAWLPVVAVGFLVSAWRPEGEALDERVAHWATWRVRRIHRRGTGEPALLSAGPRRLPSAGAGALRDGPADRWDPARLSAARRARTALSSLRRAPARLGWGTSPPRRDRPALGGPAGPGEVLVDGARAPGAGGLPGARLRALPPTSRPKGPPRALDPRRGPGRAARLDQGTRALASRLAAVGLRPTRLETRALSEAGHRFGWSRPRGDD